MRTLDEIIEVAARDNATLQVNSAALARVTDATVDGLFHIPLLALTILIVARERGNGLPTADVANWTLATLVKHFEALALPRNHIRWSVMLRRRCADALVFLERTGLVEVREAPARTAFSTPNGNVFVRKNIGCAEEIGVLTRQLERAHRAVQHSGLELL